MSKLDGGCLCGNVRYSSDAEPIMTGVCHCSNCQKQSGSSFSIVVGLPKDGFSVSGKTLSTFHDSNDSGDPVERFFCSHCGSPIFTAAKAMPEAVFVKAGTLDDRSWLQPQMNIWCASAQPWVTIDDNLPKFERNPG